MNWHYSEKMPIGKLVTFGVWEDEKFIGAIIFGRGANPHMANSRGLRQDQAVELIRVALRSHLAPVSQIVGIALKQLNVTNPGLRLVVSYADPEQNHVGTIYQAGNWIFTGQGPQNIQYFFEGKWYHSRMIGPAGFGGHSAISRLSKEEQRNLVTRKIAGKYSYLMPLDKGMRRQIERLRQPYPQAVEGSMVSRNTSGIEGQVRPLLTALKVDAND
jgi:hypothetical protein